MIDNFGNENFGLRTDMGNELFLRVFRTRYDNTMPTIIISHMDPLRKNAAEEFVMEKKYGEIIYSNIIKKTKPWIMV